MGTLDQGWWPDGLLTPPSEEAMAYDIKVIKFNPEVLKAAHGRLYRD